MFRKNTEYNTTSQKWPVVFFMSYLSPIRDACALKKRGPVSRGEDAGCYEKECVEKGISFI